MPGAPPHVRTSTFRCGSRPGFAIGPACRPLPARKCLQTLSERYYGPRARRKISHTAGRRSIPAGCVAPRRNTLGITPRRALPAGCLNGLPGTLFRGGPSGRPDPRSGDLSVDQPQRGRQVRAGLLRLDDAQQPVGRHAHRPHLLRAGRARHQQAPPLRRRRSVLRSPQQGMERGCPRRLQRLPGPSWDG